MCLLNKLSYISKLIYVCSFDISVKYGGNIRYLIISYYKINDRKDDEKYDIGIKRIVSIVLWRILLGRN